MARPRKYEDDTERLRAKRDVENRAVKKYYEDKHRIHATFTKEEFSMLDAAAKKNGVSPTRYVKEAALIRIQEEERKRSGK